MYKSKNINLFFLNFLICFKTGYYLLIFGVLYKKTQISLLLNYFFGAIESLLYSFGISLLIFIVRFFNLKFQIRQLYRTSVYLNNLL